MRRLYHVFALFIISGLAACTERAPQDGAADEHTWLEDKDGERSMEWVRAENAKTTAVLEQDARYASNYATALRMAQAADRIPYVSFVGGQLYNFWQDSVHIRGIWRSTTLESYQSQSPQWTTVLDLDALAKAENANWVWAGWDCNSPNHSRCLINLSDGGEDAVTVREFDLKSKSFVTDGFVLDKGKQRVAWMGADTLLVSREWTPGELTSSGYPFVVKRLLRGQPVAQAVEIYRGSATDGGYGVSPTTLEDAEGHRVSLIVRPTTTFEFEFHLVRPADVARLSIPAKAQPVALFNNQVIVQLSQSWQAGATTLPSGALVAFDAERAMTTPDALAPVTIFAPGPRESVGGASSTRNALLVDINRNVTGKVLIYTRATDGTWSQRTLPLPDNVSTSVTSADKQSDRAFVNVTGYLTPSSVLLADASTATARSVKSLVPRFDASDDVVEQREVASSDGTMVPYFIVHPKGMSLDGTNPTILYAYGGFEVSLTPSYNAEVGKLWIDNGGVYVVANIRGGGEFGPAWHEAGLKTKRQIVYDDFAAVARDLIDRKITSPQHLGIQGGSNGGLQVGVQMTQHPELFNAVDIAVPLLDMLRFEQIQAGASWVGEYGSVSNPDERAFLASISPYNNLRDGVKYPMPFIWTTTKDDRVGPQHARKFAAKMAAMGLPYLFYEVIEGGHGSGANAEQQAHTAALEYTYFMRQLMPAEKSASE